jgi:nucleoside-diphosphate-sugar epimerase
LEKILVTGGTGFLGAYIIKELVLRGYSVRAMKRTNSRPPFYIDQQILNRTEWVTGDILDVMSLDEAMDGVDKVIHSAAMVSFNGKDHKQMEKINVSGTANVVNLAMEKKISRLVHISSVSALGRTGNKEMINEEKQWQENKSNTGYGHSKYKAEMEVWRAHAEGLNAVIVNPSTILGYGDWEASSCRIFKSVYDGLPWYTNGTNGFVDVNDVARVVAMLVDSQHEGERFILNSDNWTFRELFNTIADSLGKKRPRFYATPFLGELAWRIEKLKATFSGSSPLLTRESARVAHSTTRFDNSKILRSLTGFSFTPLKQTIVNACKSYLEKQSGKVFKTS